MLAIASDCRMDGPLAPSLVFELRIWFVTPLPCILSQSLLISARLKACYLRNDDRPVPKGASQPADYLRGTDCHRLHNSKFRVNSVPRTCVIRLREIVRLIDVDSRRITDSMGEISTLW